MIILCACDKGNLSFPPDRATLPRTMAEYLSNNFNLSFYTAALKRVGMLDSLNKPDNLTLFVPDNDAFKEIGITRIQQIEKMDLDSLEILVKEHIIEDKFFSEDFPEQLDNPFTSIGNTPLFISRIEEFKRRSILINGSAVKLSPFRDISVSNGVVHIINKPLFRSNKTIQEHLESIPNLKLFVQLLKQFNLWDQLKTEGPLTVFALPNNVLESYKLTSDSIAKLNSNKMDPVYIQLQILFEQKRRIFSKPGGSLKFREEMGIDLKFVPVTSSSPVWPSIEIQLPTQLKTINYLNNGYRGEFMDLVLSNGVVHQMNDFFITPKLKDQKK